MKIIMKTLLIPLIGILTFVSCSSGDNTTKYDYCVYMEREICLSGSYESCQNGGTPSNTCPNGYNKGEGNSSSSSFSSSSVGSNNNNSSSSKNIVSSSSINSNNNSSSSVGGGYTGEYGSVVHCNQTYKTVVIGTQTWFAEDVNCSTYGRLYDLETAKTVCPTGWHLPSFEDWGKMILYVDSDTGTGTETMDDYGEPYYFSPTAGRYLKATSGWEENGNGEDKYGFSALPNRENLYFGDWWSSTDYGEYGSVYIFCLDAEDESAYFDGKGSSHSVRCVKD